MADAIVMNEMIGKDSKLSVFSYVGPKINGFGA